MRKKIAMRRGGKVAKYAEGGRVHGGQRPTEDRERMAREAAARFDEEEAGLARRQRERTNRPSLITNTPVGALPLPSGPQGDVMMPRRVGPAEDSAEATAQRDAARPTRMRTRATPVRRAVRPTRTARRTSADDLNDREMTRILNERSLEAARAGRNMFKKGGKVSAKKEKK